MMDEQVGLEIASRIGATILSDNCVANMNNGKHFGKQKVRG